MTSSWSDTPIDLLWKIIELLPLTDYVRFGAVCIAWRSALAENRRPPAFAPPWLMLFPYDCGTHTHRFLDLSERKEYCIQMPEVSHTHTFTASCVPGWLHSLNPHDPNSEIHMFHPVSRRQLRFPPIHTLSALPLPPHGTEGWPHRIKLVIMPYPTSYIAAATTCFESRNLGIAREGSKSWTVIDTGGDHEDPFVDVIFYKQQLHALTMMGEFIVCDISDVSNPRVSLTVESPPFLNTTTQYYEYLVESGGDLLMVWRQMIQQPDPVGFNTTGINVFKLNPLHKWVEIKSLGNHALFLSYSHELSLSISTEDVPELRENCIYLMEGELRENCIYLMEGGLIKVYHIREKSFVPLPNQWPLNVKLFPPAWFTPTLSST